MTLATFVRKALKLLPRKFDSPQSVLTRQGKAEGLSALVSRSGCLSHLHPGNSMLRGHDCGSTFVFTKYD